MEERQRIDLNEFPLSGDETLKDLVHENVGEESVGHETPWDQDKWSHGDDDMNESNESMSISSGEEFVTFVRIVLIVRDSHFFQKQLHFWRSIER